MLRTNSKKARENVRNYIIAHFDGENYENGAQVDTNDFKAVSAFIMEVFESEKPRNNGIKQDIFVEWCAGLPTVLDTCYYYNRSAVDDLAIILEETDSEKARYTEAQAQNYLTYLIYSEIIKAL